MEQRQESGRNLYATRRPLGGNQLNEIMIAVMTTVIVGSIGWLTNIVIKNFKEHDFSHNLLQEANLNQIKVSLIFMYRNARDNENKITSHELEAFNDLFTVYKKLGGNGFIETIKNKMQKLDIVDDWNVESETFKENSN